MGVRDFIRYKNALKLSMHMRSVSKSSGVTRVGVTRGGATDGVTPIFPEKTGDFFSRHWSDDLF